MKRYLKTHKMQFIMLAVLAIAMSFGIMPDGMAETCGFLIGGNTITQAFVQQFDSTIQMQAQQKTSRFEPRVHGRGNITGESFTANKLAAVEDTPENNVRHGDTTWSTATHSTRVALMRDFYQALPVSRSDEPKLLANPSGEYMNSLLSAWNRRKDSIIFTAALGAAQLKDGSTVALPSGQKILHGSTAMSKAKIITAKKIFRKNEADEQSDDPQELYLAYTSEMLEDILSDTTLTSADFMAVKMLQEGNISGKWCGFNWVPYESVQLSGGVYSTIAWAKSSIHFGTGFFEGKSQRRGDKKDMLQVSAAGSVGAVRVWEEGVVEIQFQ